MDPLSSLHARRRGIGSKGDGVAWICVEEGGESLEQEVVEDDLLDVAADEPRKQRWPRSVGG